MAVWNALDDAVETESAKVVREFSSGIVGWIEAQQLRQQDAHFRVGEPAELKTEDDQYGEQSLDARITEPQSRSSLTVDLGRPDYPIKSILPNRAIVGNLLDVEKTPVGLQADLPQTRARSLRSLPIKRSALNDAAKLHVLLPLRGGARRNSRNDEFRARRPGHARRTLVATSSPSGDRCYPR